MDLFYNAASFLTYASSLFLCVVYAALNLIGVYHTSILRRAAQHKAKELGQPELAQDSAFNKYILFWKQRSRWNKTATTFLTVIAYTQVLIEMGVRKKWGKRAQWKIIALLEAVK
jgi:peroxin-16